MTKNYELNLNKAGDITSSLMTISFPKIIALVIAISYGGGLWINIQHELEGARETHELTPVLHWLRDSTLAMVFIFFGVLMALAFSRWVIRRANGRMPGPAQVILITICTGAFTGAAFAFGIPAHGYLFGGHMEEGADLIVHMLNNGYWSALVNTGIAALMIFVMNGLE